MDRRVRVYAGIATYCVAVYVLLGIERQSNATYGFPVFSLSLLVLLLIAVDLYHIVRN